MKTKGEGKTMVSKKMKWVGLVGLVVSALSLVTHFLLARHTYGGAVSEFRSSVTIFSWRPIFDNADLPTANLIHGRLWGPVRPLEYLHADANPGSNYPAPEVMSTGFIFVRIRGGFHEIRNSISDVVAVARLLNATLVVPEIQSTTSSKGISSEFKSFAYLYNEDQFMAALANDVKIVKTLPKNLKGARRKKEIPSFRVSYSASPYFYLRHVLPVLTRHSVVELVVSDGGCLQSTLPSHLIEYQKLRCRVAFHALRFRDEVQELAIKILNRLRASGRPFLAYDPGMTRDALAYHGCAELFQDVHTELILHRRSWMIKRRILKGNLSVDSAKQRLNGLCPLMPEEVGILLRAYGYKPDTIIYISGGEVFGGRKQLIPLHAMFDNLVDRTSLSTLWELSKMYGRETTLVDKHSTTPLIKEDRKSRDWKTSGPRPRPLPPPPARPKSYNIEGWWGWVAESDNEPESSIEELRTNAHKLLWEAIDYIICLEADAFLAGFDRDGKGHPNFASLVMGHRLYQFAPSRTYNPNRKEIAKLFEEIRDTLYQANRTWITSIRKSLRRNLVDGLVKESKRTRPLSLLAFPIPECSCTMHVSTEKSANASSPSPHSQISDSLGPLRRCPSWMMNDHAISQSKEESEEDVDLDDSLSSGLFFRQTNNNNNNNHEGDSGEISNKEEALVEDQEELEGGER
ncbi:O-fucosyltransferase 27 isoform X2 [Ipomoea triloba]|uniref:O-fucosyltransferase 27 isoform X2 n=1 Tax=Ipomoea triloba TaxID=35885 RepID=UPI00125DC726|nr:O-fucosyltransferase 27 isoform X2 [Ipomoea triloba]